MKRNIYEGYRPRAKGEQRFVDKHVVYHNPDNEGNGDDVFKASNIKKVDRKAARLGYEPGEDEKVYEASEEPTHIVVFEKGHRVGARSRRNVHVSANGENHAIKLAKNEFPDHKEQGYRIKEVHDLNESVIDKVYGYGQHLDTSSDGSGDMKEGVINSLFGKKKPKITVTRRPGNVDPLYPKMVAAKKADKKSESVEKLDELAGPSKTSMRTRPRRDIGSRDRLYSALPGVLAKVAAEREAKADENNVAEIGFKVPHANKPGGKPEPKANTVPMGFRKEDIINNAIERYLPENHFTRSREDYLIETVSSLPESMARTLITLYEALDEDNKAILIDACTTRNGINAVLDFAIREGRK